jgi:hypothetical protein
VNRLLCEIEGALKLVWESEMRSQGERAITHKPGDLLWREKVGWAVCLAETQARAGQSVKVRLQGVEKDVMAGYYVNLSEVCLRSPALGHLIDELRQAVTGKFAFDCSDPSKKVP